MIAVISPHLDDGVFACGALLATQPGSVVVTAFAGGAARWETVTPWDAACGFAPGDDVVAARRAEDREALALLRATPVWLDFPDAQYGPSPRVETLAEALARVLDDVRPVATFVPLGLFHSDHRLAADAALHLARAQPAARWFVYEDALYRRIPGLSDAALAALEAAGLRLADAGAATPPPCAELKRRAVECYRSQLKGFATPGRSGHDDCFAPERYWRLIAYR